MDTCAVPAALDTACVCGVRASFHASEAAFSSRPDPSASLGVTRVGLRLLGVTFLVIPCAPLVFPRTAHLVIARPLVLSFRAQSRNLPPAGRTATGLGHGHVRYAGGAGHGVCLWRACDSPRVGGWVLFVARPLGFARGDKSGTLQSPAGMTRTGRNPNPTARPGAFLVIRSTALLIIASALLLVIGRARSCHSERSRGICHRRARPLRAWSMHTCAVPAALDTACVCGVRASFRASEAAFSSRPGPSASLGVTRGGASLPLRPRLFLSFQTRPVMPCRARCLLSFQGWSSSSMQTRPFLSLPQGPSCHSERSRGICHRPASPLQAWSMDTCATQAAPDAARVDEALSCSRVCETKLTGAGSRQTAFPHRREVGATHASPLQAETCTNARSQGGEFVFDRCRPAA